MSLFVRAWIIAYQTFHIGFACFLFWIVNQILTRADQFMTRWMLIGVLENQRIGSHVPTHFDEEGVPMKYWENIGGDGFHVYLILAASIILLNSAHAILSVVIMARILILKECLMSLFAALVLLSPAMAIYFAWSFFLRYMIESYQNMFANRKNIIRKAIGYIQRWNECCGVLSVCDLDEASVMYTNNYQLGEYYPYCCSCRDGVCFGNTSTYNDYNRLWNGVKQPGCLCKMLSSPLYWAYFAILCMNAGLYLKMYVDMGRENRKSVIRLKKYSTCNC